MILSTDVLHEFCYDNRYRGYVCIKVIMGFIYLKIKWQNQERYENVVIYDLGLILCPKRLYTAPFNI